MSFLRQVLQVLDELINYSPYNDEVVTIHAAHNHLRHRAHQIRGDFDFLPFSEYLAIGKAIVYVRGDKEFGVPQFSVEMHKLAKPLTETEISAVKMMLETDTLLLEGETTAQPTGQKEKST